MLPYGEMKKLIASRKLGPQLGDYFLYELCDSLRRFEVCGAPTAAAAVELPETWYTRRGLAKLLQQILSDEEMSPERITLILPAGAAEKPTKILTENRTACEALGLRFVTAAEAAQTLSAIDPVPRTEDEAAFNVAPTVPPPEPEPEQTPEPAPAAEPEELPDNSWNKYAASALEDDDDDDEDEASGESEAET